jgi:hypothetical protein
MVVAFDQLRDFSTFVEAIVANMGFQADDLIQDVSD